MSRLWIAQVAPGIWSVRRGRGGSSSYLVKTDPGGILIDAGSDPEGGDVMRCLQTARVGLRSIRAILLTHVHRHAAAGARALRERSGAPLLASRQEAETFALGQGTPGAPFGPDAHLADGERVEPFVRVIATPGHSKGHLAFWIEPIGVLFTGDAVSVRVGAPELSPGTVDSERARASMRRCLALEPRLLLPAHGEPLPLSGRRTS